MADRTDEIRRRRRLPQGISPAVILGCTTAVFALCSLLGGTKTDPADQPVWQPLLHAHDQIMMALGTDQLGSVYVTKERLLSHFAEPDDDTLSASADAVNRFAAAQNTPVYMLAVPTSSAIYGDTLPDSAPLANEHQILHRFSDALGDSVVWIESASWLSAEKEQYIYYRTDPCWTAYGAFCVYRSAIRRLGFTAIGYDQYSVRHFGSDYYGRLAEQCHYYDLRPDTVDMYYLNNTEESVTVTALTPEGSTALPGYYRTDLPEAKEHPELIFGTESEPVLRIETSNQNSRDLLLLTDSFGGSMVPFLMRHYHSITAVNLTKAVPEWSALTDSAYSQILILCGTDTLSDPDILRTQLAVPKEE